VARTIRIRNLEFPLDRRYFTRKGAHIWLLPGKDGTVRIGMDSFLTENAGYLNYISLDRKAKVRRGASLGSFESAKFVSKLYSPVSGEVVAVNQEVMKDPRRINRDPYGSWIVALRPGDLDRELRSPDLLGEEKGIRRWMREEMRKAENEE
jgi:glycine cleavage system H protein